jgi:hypothetical protein
MLDEGGSCFHRDNGPQNPPNFGHFFRSGKIEALESPNHCSASQRFGLEEWETLKGFQVEEEMMCENEG